MSLSRLTVRGLMILLGLGAVAPSSRSAVGQTVEELTPGKVLRGSSDWDGSSRYSFRAGSAGILTVVARSLNESDLYLLVTDADGQPLPNGRSDQDLGGDAGAEQFAVSVPRAGVYRVLVETFGGGQASFQLGVSWLPFPELELPQDPDGSPGTATRLSLGQDAHEDSIDGSAGDIWDWFVLKIEKTGTLTVATRTDGGDLVLEAFEGGEFAEPLEASDQDLQGNGGNEAVTLAVEPGQEFYFKVSAFSEAVTVRYRLQVGFIPG